MKRLFLFLLICALVLGTVRVNAAGSTRAADLEIEPAQINIGFFYSGKLIRLHAEIPSGYDAIVKVTGPDEDLHLKKKGKAGGFLWMNVGEVAFENVPQLYMIRSSRELSRMQAGDFLSSMRIGYDDIGFKADVKTEKEKKFLSGELIKLKEKQGMYSIDEGNVQHRTNSSGNQDISTEITLPARAPIGMYEVALYGVKNGKGVKFGSGKIEIKQSAPVAFLTSLAHQHGLLYGCLAVAIAVITGLGTGAIFGMKGKAH